MKEKYFWAGLYTDERCSIMFQKAVEHIENKVNELLKERLNIKH